MADGIWLKADPQQVETNIYWNLLKDLDEDLKIQLVTRLKKSLSAVVRTNLQEFKVTQIKNHLTD